MTHSNRATYGGSAAAVAAGLPAEHAVRVGDLLFISGQVAIDAQGAIVTGDVAGQADHIFSSLRSILEEAGGSMANVVEVTSFHTDARDMDTVFNVGREYFAEADGFPAWTPVGYVGTTVPGALVMLRAVADLGPTPKTSFALESQPWAEALPTAAATRAGDLVFIAGQTAMDAEQQVELPLDHLGQSRRCYDNMFEVLAQAGGTVDDVLDFTSYHHDIRGAEPTLEQIYIPDVMGPIDTDEAASTSHVGSTGLYRDGVLGAYTAIADLTPGVRVGSTPDLIWWKGKYPIAGAARKDTGRLVTIAGQVGSAPDGSIVFEGDVEGQVRFIFDSMRQTLQGFGMTMDDIVDVRSFHKDPRWAPVVAEVASEFFESALPAWTYGAMQGLWFEGYLHEIAAIAIAP